MHSYIEALLGDRICFIGIEKKKRIYNKVSQLDVNE